MSNEGRQETILEILGIIAADQESDVDTADPQAVPINDALLRAPPIGLVERRGDGHIYGRGATGAGTSLLRENVHSPSRSRNPDNVRILARSADCEPSRRLQLPRPSSLHSAGVGPRRGGYSARGTYADGVSWRCLVAPQGRAPASILETVLSAPALYFVASAAGLLAAPTRPSSSTRPRSGCRLGRLSMPCLRAFRQVRSGSVSCSQGSLRRLWKSCTSGFLMRGSRWPAAWLLP